MFSDYYYDYDTAEGITCGYDTLEIRDGEESKSPLMERLCGNENNMSLPMTFMSIENSVVVRLVKIFIVYVGAIYIIDLIISNVTVVLLLQVYLR